MTDFFVPLRATNGVSGIVLHPPCGADELLVEDASTRTALLLLDHMLHSATGIQSATVLKASEIVTADRDRIFANLFIAMYGSKIESTIICKHCNIPFDLDFSLASLLDHYPITVANKTEDGIFHIDKSISFRLPTGADELLLTEISETAVEDFLLSKCLVKGNIRKVGALVQQKMTEIAPVLNLDIQALCPECEHDQQLRFDIQTFFLTRLKQERPQLLQEVHHIARTYHWDHGAILNLPRDLRKQYFALIQLEQQ